MMLYALLDCPIKMIVDVGREIYFIFIFKVEDEVIMIPQNLINATFSEDQTTNKNFEQ